MPTNRERILRAIEVDPGLTDAELRSATGVEPHQQVNQICRALEREGLVERTVGDRGRIVNLPARTGARPPQSDDSAAVRSGSERSRATPPECQAPRHRARGTSALDVSSLPEPGRTLVIVPCSGRKLTGGDSPRGPSADELLPNGLRAELVDARRRIAAIARVDESRTMPAIQRYVGGFYEMGEKAIRGAAADGQPMLILSGGYGVLLPAEPIGWYERSFKMADWPTGLLQRCLLALTEAARVEAIVAFCARSTDYAALVRSTTWADCHLTARLVYPLVGSGSGAQSVVPRVLGRAVATYLENGEVRPTDGPHDLVVESL